jgi:hypothetical protein
MDSIIVRLFRTISAYFNIWTLIAIIDFVVTVHFSGDPCMTLSAVWRHLFHDVILTNCDVSYRCFLILKKFYMWNICIWFQIVQSNEYVFAKLVHKENKRKFFFSRDKLYVPRAAKGFTRRNFGTLIIPRPYYDSSHWNYFRKSSMKVILK